VVGEFNHGKTTFVNALLGQSVLPVGVTPTTATIHHLKYAETPEATVVYASGRRESIPFERREEVRGRRRIFGRRGRLPRDRLPGAAPQERILLVDTPGVNDLSLQRADITYSYIPRADAVLFLLDAGQILKESERVFLEDKLSRPRATRSSSSSRSGICSSPEEQAEALAYAKNKLAKLVKDPVVFPVSAETALGGRRREERDSRSSRRT
jgi:GTPase Era involved in 16S rRNA processing